MTMVEKVARAVNPFPFVARTEIEQRRSSGEIIDAVWVDRINGQIVHAIAQARAAIEAMREPSEEMCEAGAKYYHDNYRAGHAKEDTSMPFVWDEMISAALADKKTSQ